jgi:diamine N-acetyltransferase
MQVELREISQDTVRAICKLQVAPSQLGFVAPNAVSLAQALFHPEAWYRAIYADGEPAGFLMLEDRSQLGTPVTEVGLWRLMVDARFQGCGVGRAALQQCIAMLHERGGLHRLLTSYVPGEGCPEPFYRSLGFLPTGEVDEGEVVMALPL